MSSPIGLFDSGVGGLTVLNEVIKALPNEDIVYLGDTARLPYGNKSPEAILRFSLQNADFLLSQNIKLLIVSCHTACSYALALLQASLPIPVLGVQEAGIADLKTASQTKRVALLGTAATISSGVFQKLLQADHFQIFPVACPLFVPLVEEGFHNHEATKLIAAHYLSPLNNSRIDAALLGCTHYPLLIPIIQEILGLSVKLIEPARSTALAARKLLQEKCLLNQKKSLPTYRFFATDNPDKFQQLAKVFFSLPIDTVMLV